ncbi:MAG: hypothetical protein KC422_10860 [Trueperaceae bacterium]|nr:hypothetical protein [Trueperaceae bacterium]
MFMALLLSSIAAGLIATSVMLFFLYLPLLWRGAYYDVLGAIGSYFTKEIDARSRFLGLIFYALIGVVFSLLYGLLALITLNNLDQLTLPSLTLPGIGIEMNSAFLLFGFALGLGHGIIVGLIATIVFIEHHPLEHYRKRLILVISQLISHIVFGITVMFFQSQFLQLLLRT